MAIKGKLNSKKKIRDVKPSIIYIKYNFFTIDLEHLEALSKKRSLKPRERYLTIEDKNKITP